MNIQVFLPSPAENTEIALLCRSTIPLVIHNPSPEPPPACNISGLN